MPGQPRHPESSRPRAKVSAVASYSFYTHPSLRIDHNVAIGTEALVSGTGILLLLFWGISSAHLQFIMREFGFTRSGLLWHKDRDREQQLIVDEIRDDDRLKTKRLKSG